MAHTVKSFNIIERTEKYIKGWVSSEDDVNAVIEAHSIETGSQFVTWHDDRKRKAGSSTGRLFWKHKDLPDLNGYPFMLGRHVIKVCHYGKSHKRRKSETKVVPDLHEYSKGQRFHVQPSRKVGCGAQIVVRHVSVFSDRQYCAKDIPVRSQKRQAILQDILNRLKNESPQYTGEEKIYICLPLCAAHSKHSVNPKIGLGNRINDGVKCKIYETVNMGITNINVVKKILKTFVQAEFANKDVKPSIFDRAYYPLSKDIKNHIHTAIASGKLCSLDQENLKKKIEAWKSEDLDRLFYYRPATERLENTDGEKFLFLHQENWQRRLLKMYGNTVSLLDATYRTTKYSLPFFMLVVRTNVEYIPVAQFVTEDETSESIQEALQILRNWNPEWCPAYFMVDYSEAEINSIKAEFESTKILLCAFHREQAWERWSRSEKNISTADREDFLERMRELAYSSTQGEYKAAEERLRSCRWFKPPVQKYVENKWLSVKEYWCRAFQELGFHSAVTTTNGVEALNRSLKHFYLKLANPGTLSTLFEVVIKEFLPDLFQNYVMLNYRSSTKYKAYDDSIPDYLIDCPRKIVEHCMKRLHSSDHFGSGDVNSSDTTDGIYHVKSVDKVYEVNFGSETDYPHCTCKDFEQHFLPCKHFFAVFRNTDQNWNDLPALYKHNPYLNIDPEAFKTDRDEEEEISANLETSATAPQKVAENQNIAVDPGESSRLRREVVVMLKDLQNKAYICCDESAFRSCLHILKDVNDLLSEKVSPKLPLRSSRLRMLPSRKRKFKQFGKFHHRVGKKAKVMREASVLDVHEDLAVSDVDTSSLKGRRISRRNAKLQLKKEKQKREEQITTLDSGTYEDIENTKGLSTVASPNQDKTKESSLSESVCCTDLAVQDKTRALELMRKLWAMEEDRDIPVAKVGGNNLCDTDIRSLRPGKWLTDMVMDSYIALLTVAENDVGRKVVHFVQTKMTSIMEGSLTALRSNQRMEEEFDAEIIIGTYYRSGHWTLVIVEMKKGIIYFYNPCGERVVEMNKIERNWRKYMESLQSFNNANPPVRKWTITNVAHSKQKDSFNCGVYCLIFAEKHLNNKLEELQSITLDDLNNMRITVAHHLLLYEVYLTGCCPKCGFDIADDEYINCCNCQRSYHLRSYCIEKELQTDDTSLDFECSLCKINWPVCIKNTEGSNSKNPPEMMSGKAPSKAPNKPGSAERKSEYISTKRARLTGKRSSFSYINIRRRYPSVYKYRLRENPTKARKRSSFVYGDVHGRYPKKTAKETFTRTYPNKPMRRIKRTHQTQDVDENKNTAELDTKEPGNWIYTCTEAKSIQCQNIVKLLCLTSPEKDLAVCKGEVYIEEQQLSILFEEQVKERLRNVININNGCTDYHQPHWRHLSWVKGVSLSHNLEMRHNEIGVKERLKIFGKKGLRELYGLVLEAFGVFKPKTKIRIGYSPGHFLSVRNCQHTLLSATLEDEMAQNLNRGFEYFRDVLFVEAEILVVSVLYNMPITDVDRKLYPLPLFQQNVN